MVSPPIISTASPTSANPFPPTIHIPSPPDPPKISLSHLLDLPPVVTEKHGDEGTEGNPAESKEENTAPAPLIAQECEGSSVADPPSLPTSFDVRSYCFSPNSDAGSINGADTENVLEQEAEVQGILNEVQDRFEVDITELPDQIDLSTYIEGR